MNVREGTRTVDGSPCRRCGSTLRYARNKACIACSRASCNKWDKRNRGRAAENARRTNWKKYGLTPEQYDELLERQGFACAICYTQDTSPWDHFAVDHNHRTGKVRGLLCGKCNTAISRFDDDPDRAFEAALYLLEL